MSNWFAAWEKDVDISLNSFIERELNNTTAPESYQLFFKNLKQEIGKVTNHVDLLSEDILKANAERNNYKEYYMTLNDSYNDVTELYKKEHWLRLEKETSLLEAWGKVSEQKELLKTKEEKIEKLTAEVESLTKKLETATALSGNNNNNNNNTNTNENYNNSNRRDNDNQPERANNTDVGTTVLSDNFNNFTQHLQSVNFILKREYRKLQENYYQSMKANETLTQQNKALENQLLQAAQKRQTMESQLVEQLKEINNWKVKLASQEEERTQNLTILKKLNQELIHYKVVYLCLNKLPEGVNLLNKLSKNNELHRSIRILSELHLSHTQEQLQLQIHLLQQQQQQQYQQARPVGSNNGSHANDGSVITLLPPSSPTAPSSNFNPNYRPQ
ncbi:hypothetical protein BJ944DRAFT_126583 [Cunninghamella echinulata]|nr:hypothetical protein BJ944DRAFT_126583 [Cunninghamella echinulata]